MSNQNEEKKLPKGASGLAIPAGLLIGIGIGFLVGNVAAFTMIGLGAGFALMIVVRLIVGDW